MRIIKKTIPWVIFVILIAVDQISKMLAVKNLRDKEAYKLIKNILHFEYTTNAGAAWGMLSGKIPMFLILTVIITFIIVYIYLKTPNGKKYNFVKAALILILAGAIGNMIDRVLNGYVHDFIYFLPIDFPIFNIADSYIVVGTILLSILILFVLKDDDFDYLFKKKEKKND